MSYKDIRYFDIDGTPVPIGHPRMASWGAKGINSKSVVLSITSCSDGAAGTGPLCITACNSSGQQSIITLSLDNCVPESTYTCAATSKDMYPDKILSLSTSGGACIIEIRFPKAVQDVTAVADIENLQIMQENGTLDNTAQSLTYRSTVLKEGVDYGTTSQRDELGTGNTGRIFYVIEE